MGSAPERRLDSLKPLLFLLIPALLIGNVYFALRASKDWPIDELDRGVVETYCRLIAEERFEEAFESCLTANYRREISLPEFEEAHRKTREQRGELLDREVLRVEASTNLFSAERSFKLLYRLRYTQGEWRDYIEINDADGEWRIEGTYKRGAKHLEHFIW